MLSLILIPILIGVAMLIGVFAPEILSWVIGQMGGESGLYFYLISLPYIQPIPEQTASFEQGGLPIQAYQVGHVAYSLYGTMQTIAFFLFTIALVVAALVFAFESFRVVGHGTAVNILTSSFFTLVMLFLFPTVWNACAGLINYLTHPYSHVILEPGMLQDVARKMAEFSGGGFTWEGAKNALAQLFLGVFFLVLGFAVTVSVAVMGLLRVFFIGAVCVLMPIMLVLRLIPQIQRIADTFIEVCIGLSVASLVAAVFFRFGYHILYGIAGEPGWVGFSAVIAAIGTVLAAAMMPTILAPRMGWLFSMAGQMVTGATVAGALAITGAATGAAVGGVGGLAGALVGGRAALRAVGVEGPIGIGEVAKAVGARGLLGAFASGALSGGLAGAYGMARGGGSPAGVVRAGVRIAEATRAAHQTAFGRILQDRAGTVFNTMALHNFTEPVSGENATRGEELWSQIKAMSNEDLGRFVADKAGIGSAVENPETARMIGKGLRGRLTTAYERFGPEGIHRFFLNTEQFRNLSDKEKLNKIIDWTKNTKEYEERWRRMVGGEWSAEELKKADFKPQSYQLVLSEVAGKEGVVAGSILIREGTQGLIKGTAKGKINLEEAKNFAKEVKDGNADLTKIVESKGFTLTPAAKKHVNNVFREEFAKKAAEGNPEYLAFMGKLKKAYDQAVNGKTKEVKKLDLPPEKIIEQGGKRAEFLNGRAKSKLEELTSIPPMEEKITKALEEKKKLEEEELLKAIKKTSKNIRDIEEEE